MRLSKPLYLPDDICISILQIAKLYSVYKILILNILQLRLRVYIVWYLTVSREI